MKIRNWTANGDLLFDDYLRANEHLSSICYTILLIVFQLPEWEWCTLYRWCIAFAFFIRLRYVLR